ncbi:unnamed protein product [Protopolystoma xenopodis]|uniref:Uncharacterized protein n=1 Tax=Protopolystoma xenopodis TaxID=117903 RepID=A0A3S5A6C2_9PLAT|nr:unnamed protein product [Protopolystoma xenopodis]
MLPAAWLLLIAACLAASIQNSVYAWWWHKESESPNPANEVSTTTELSQLRLNTPIYSADLQSSNNYDGQLSSGIDKERTSLINETSYNASLENNVENDQNPSYYNGNRDIIETIDKNSGSINEIISNSSNNDIQKLVKATIPPLNRLNSENDTVSLQKSQPLLSAKAMGESFVSSVPEAEAGNLFGRTSLEMEEGQFGQMTFVNCCKAGEEVAHKLWRRNEANDMPHISEAELKVLQESNPQIEGNMQTQVRKIYMNCYEIPVIKNDNYSVSFACILIFTIKC